MKEKKSPNFSTRLNVILTAVSIGFFVKYINLINDNAITVFNTISLVIFLYMFYSCIGYFVKLFKGTLTEDDRSGFFIKISLDEKVFRITDKVWYYIFSSIIVISATSFFFLPTEIYHYIDIILTLYIIVYACIDIYQKYKK